METPNLSPNNLLLTAKDIGSFILSRLRGGAYSELSSQLNDEINQVEDTKDQADTLEVI